MKSVISGHIGGDGADPKYSNYAQKSYIEAIKIIYNPLEVGYPDLVNMFWKQIDPTF